MATPNVEETLQQLVQGMQRMQTELQELQSRGQRPTSSTTQDRHAMLFDLAASGDEDEEHTDVQDEKDTWDTVLSGQQKTQQGQQAAGFAQLCALPPPLSRITQTVKELPRYTGIPQTPPPRKQRVDQSLAAMQRKLEMCMNAIVHHLEEGDQNSLGVAGALVTSTLDCIQQSRRRILAGMQSYALKARPESHQPRLLDEVEENKVRRARATSRTGGGKGGKGFGRRDFSRNRQSFRRYPSNQRRKGKGKGRSASRDRKTDSA